MFKSGHVGASVSHIDQGNTLLSPYMVLNKPHVTELVIGVELDAMVIFLTLLVLLYSAMREKAGLKI